MSNADDWGSYRSQDEEQDADAVEALRREVAELRELLAGSLDAGEEIAVADNRRFLRERAEKDAKAAAAADDPRTLEALRAIDNEEDLAKFLRDHGGQ